MSCQQNGRRATRAGRQSGIARPAAQTGFVTGASGQRSFFRPAGNNPKKKGRSDRRRRPPSGGQASFFESKRVGGPLPTQRQIPLPGEFSADQLRQIWIELSLGEAAVARHLRELGGPAGRDPRPADWARQDLKNFRFLGRQVARARRGPRRIDTAGLKQKELADLWHFCRFEADRAHRNIDHLRAPAPLRGIRGPTADDLAANHRLMGRFYAFLAAQIEPMAPADALAQEKEWL